MGGPWGFAGWKFLKIIPHLPVTTRCTGVLALVSASIAVACASPHVAPPQATDQQLQPEPQFEMVGNLDSAADTEPVDPNLIVKGPLPPVVIRQILALHEQQLRDCAALAKLARLVLDFSIAVTGKADTVTTQQSSPSDVAACVSAAAVAWRFPEPSAPVAVHYELLID